MAMIYPCRCIPFIGLPSTGITDSFDRADDPVELGIADCGRLWAVGGDPMTIEGNQGRSPAMPLGGDHTSALPGPWPIPFNGRIDLTGGDVNPGFTYVTSLGVDPAFGPAWVDNFQGYVDGTEAHIGGVSILPHLTGGSAVAPGALTPRTNRLHYDPDAAVTVTGHIRMVETDSGTATSGDRPGSVGPTLDRYIRIGFGLFLSIGNKDVIFGGGALDTAVLLITGSGATILDSADFAANFWRDTGECDFTITYTGGAFGCGGTLTADFGGVVVSATMDASACASGRWGADNSSYDDGDPWRVPCAEMNISSLEINGKPITDLGWDWRVKGMDINMFQINYRVGYVSMGGFLPYAITFSGDPSKWPYTAATPAIYAAVTDIAGTRLTVLPLGGDLTFPFTPIVAISGSTITLTIGGASVSESTTYPVSVIDNSVSGIADELEHTLRNGQGTYLMFNDLDVAGVGPVTGPVVEGPITNQPVNDELVGVGDGVETAFTTAWPYIGISLQVQVAGVLSPLDTTGPATGDFALLDPAPPGAEVRATYLAAGA